MKISAASQQKGSTVYCLFSLTRSRQYIGMVEKRPWVNRYEEHHRQIQQHLNGTETESEEKYKYMCHGEWHMLPLLQTESPLPLSLLHKVEAIVTREFPNPLNKFYRRSTARNTPYDSGKVKQVTPELREKKQNEGHVS